VIRRAAVPQARAAIVLTDSSGQNTLTNADERTILASLAIKSLNENVVVSAELINPDNEQHLTRAKVDNILIAGEFNGFIFSAATFSKGISAMVKEMLSLEGRSRIKVSPIPPAFVGKTFGELMEHFIKAGKGILIGLLMEEKKISFDDLISDDTSAIDVFIKRKFAEASIDLAGEEARQERIMLNPGPDHVISDMVSAFLISSAEAA
jgi:voltage-gated potassium channel